MYDRHKKYDCSYACGGQRQCLVHTLLLEKEACVQDANG